MIFDPLDTDVVLACRMVYLAKAIIGKESRPSDLHKLATALVVAGTDIGISRDDIIRDMQASRQFEALLADDNFYDYLNGL